MTRRMITSNWRRLVHYRRLFDDAQPRGCRECAASIDASLLALDGPELIARPQSRASFSSLSLREMAVVGKTITERTSDFDGILAIAPAINWDGLMMMGLYLYVVITAEGDIAPACVCSAFKSYTTAFCNAVHEAIEGLYGIFETANLMQRAQLPHRYTLSPGKNLQPDYRRVCHVERYEVEVCPNARKPTFSN
ncbi:unnamed protein product [Clonostachys rosea]|uniref:Uncharacterized protein n=1 Tax=Bionectria ochroleuca TaxID=29856 RepID=A0ABY6V0K5_BIOOC|nr:unnamed protein product [Clonostachys rosea]